MKWHHIGTHPRDSRPIFLWEEGSEVPIIGYFDSDMNKFYAINEHVDAFGDSYVIDKFDQDSITHWAEMLKGPSHE